MIAGIPMLTLPVVTYNVMALGGGADHSGQIYGRLADRSAGVTLASGASLSVSLGDIVLALTIVAFFVDLLRWLTDAKTSVTDHVLATLLFVACIVEFLLIPQFGTSTFLLITLMTLLNVSAGLVCAAVARSGVSHDFKSRQ